MDLDEKLAAYCYKRNFLTQVIARVDLASPVSLIENQLPKAISQAALDKFPIAEPKNRVIPEVRVSSEQVHTPEMRVFTEWNFHGTERQKHATIIPNAFFVLCNRYEQYESFRDDFCSIATAFFAACEDAQPSRLGLRYVNELRIPGQDPLDWKDYLDPNLLAMFEYKIEGGKPARIFHNVDFVFDNFSLGFRFGLHNPDHPAPIRQRVFVLDFDAYHQGLLDSTDIPKELDSYHLQIQKLFERSITKKTREVLNGSD